MTGLIAATAALGACGGAEADPPAGSTPKEATTVAKPEPARTAQPVPSGRRIKVEQSDYGPILVTGSGRTIYLFDKEKRPKAECYGACATAWPPLLTKGAPVARSGASAKLLGTATRRDGTRQVTYRGHPLYLYAPESPGEILCQNVFEYGGLWLIVRPSGIPVR